MNVSYSQSESSDDVWLANQDHFMNKEVIISEKIDGENCNMYNGYIHARSIDSANSHHPSRSYVKSLHAKIKHLIPNGYRISGENVYAKHSIAYDALPSYFLVFAVFDENGICLSWDDVELWANELGFPTVPILYQGVYNAELETKLQSIWPFPSACGAAEAEGFVIRLRNPFHESDFNVSVGKWIRKNHVQTSTHWMKEKITPNGLKTCKH